MDLILTMTKDVDLDNPYEKGKEEDLLEVKDPLGRLILELEDSSAQDGTALNITISKCERCAYCLSDKAVDDTITRIVKRMEL